jgi:cellulose synthase/poly-beta-1,6-N-acetylglucosamine synthase-like glycosyltransferase
MTIPALLALGFAIALPLYAYLGYPLILRLLAAAGSYRGRSRRADAENAESGLPTVSITVPVYNEAPQIRQLIESLLRLDYPAEKRQILIVSDASRDGTQAIVQSYGTRGVELLEIAERSGKTSAENAARSHLTGEIIVNTDASIRIDPGALRHLVAAFQDPTVGLASARDLSVSPGREAPNGTESRYVGYEMRVRDLETRVGGIVGASGCLYAIREGLHRMPLPGSLSRDFAAALVARENGYRAVSVNEATCLVPRTTSPTREYGRKVRTITRGMETLLYKRHLLNPFREGRFAWMLFSHKVCRWLTPWSAVLGLVALAFLAPAHDWARWGLVAGLGLLGSAGLAWRLSERGHAALWIDLPAYLLSSNLAVLHATLRVVSGRQAPVWEPTRREAEPARAT